MTHSRRILVIYCLPTTTKKTVKATILKQMLSLFYYENKFDYIFVDKNMTLPRKKELIRYVNRGLGDIYSNTLSFGKDNHVGVYNITNGDSYSTAINAIVKELAYEYINIYEPNVVLLDSYTDVLLSVFNSIPCDFIFTGADTIQESKLRKIDLSFESFKRELFLGDYGLDAMYSTFGDRSLVLGGYKSAIMNRESLLSLGGLVDGLDTGFARIINLPEFCRVFFLRNFDLIHCEVDDASR